MTAPLLDVRDLRVEYPLRSGALKRTHGVLQAVNGVSFTINPGETLGLVGESGCGKSTTARAVLGLTPAAGGEIHFDGTDLRTLDAAAMRAKRKDLQVVFQDPSASFNPRMSVLDIVAEPLVVHDVGTRRSRASEAVALLERVGLGAHHAARRPSELSGGQRQRVGIARALALKPKLVVADEPVSALDVSVQAQVLNLLQDLQAELGLAFLFISHDLSVVKHISDRVGVMYLGRLVELADAQELYRAPRHPYTRALLSAIPKPHPGQSGDRVKVGGEVPNPADPPSGCVFSTRCRWRVDRCGAERPELRNAGTQHQVACHLDIPVASDEPGATTAAGQQEVAKP